MALLSSLASSGDSASTFGIDDFKALLSFGDQTPAALFLRFEPIARLCETLRQPHEQANLSGSMGVFVSWKFESIRRGHVDQVVILNKEQGKFLMRACRFAGMRIVDNTVFRASA